MLIGTVHGPGSPFFTVHVGEVEEEGGGSWQLSTNMSGSPVIRSNQSGQTWTITWKELLTLAREAGLEALDPVDQLVDDAAHAEEVVPIDELEEHANKERG